MTAQNNLGNMLLQGLIDLRQQKQHPSIEDVGDLFEKIAGDLAHGGTDTDVFLRQEITRMADYIEQAKREIAQMHTSSDDGEKHTASVSVQLDAVVKDTENASNEIMNVADKIQELAAGIGGEKEAALVNEAMKLYEACSFQDLTGQRINKVISIINYMDEKLHKLTALFGNEAASAPPKTAQVIQGKFSEKDLLNGPQLAQPTQADIDALFKDF